MSGPPPPYAMGGNQIPQQGQQQQQPPQQFGAPPMMGGGPPQANGGPPQQFGGPPGPGGPPGRPGPPPPMMGGRGAGPPQPGMMQPPGPASQPYGAPQGGPPSARGMPPQAMSNGPPRPNGPPQMGAPASMGAPPRQMGAPPQMGGPPPQMGAPQGGMGAPPPQQGPPQGGMGGSPMPGMPPMGIGGAPPPPRSTGGGPPQPPTAQMQGMGLAPPPNLAPSMPPNAPLRGAGVPQPMAPPGSAMAAAPPLQTAPPGQWPPGASPQQQPPMHQAHMGPMGTAPPQFGAPPPGRQQQMQQQQQQQPGGMAVSRGGPATDPRSSRIDPSQIPRPAATEKQAEGPIIHETWSNGAHNAPPSSISSYIVKDTGNCNPRAMRTSLNQCPCSSENLATTSMPFALIVQPLAMFDPRDDPLQVADFGEDGPVRCSHCKAYINPFMRWMEGGRRFQCNFCEGISDCPGNYFSHIGGDGRRIDTDQRPELSRGSVEMVATKDYMVRPAMVVNHLFVIDISAFAMESGATATACAAISGVIDNFQGGDTACVGIATYDSVLSFFSFKEGSSQPNMVVVPDVAEPYAPLPGTLVVNLKKNKEGLLELLGKIPEMFKTPAAQSAGGAALLGSLDVLKASGGKISMFMAGLPNTGANVIKPRPTNQKSGDREPQKSLLCHDPAWEAVGRACADAQVCVDLFLLTKNQMDIAVLSEVTNITGGSLYNYDQFTPELDYAQLENDLRWNIVRPQGMEALMRVRCSKGLSVEEYNGALCQRSLTDIDLAGIDSDKAILVKLKHDDKLQDTKMAYFQAALLFTNTDGQRRIRVHTLAVPCTNVLGTMYRGADMDTQFMYICRKAALSIPGGTLAAAREQATTACVDILYAYRKYCATSTSSGQLILPEALKLLPLYILALTKSGALRSDMLPDGRMAWLQRIRTFGPSQLVPLVYPRMYNVLEAGKGDELLPPALSLSSEKLDPKAVFLLENGVEAYMYIGKQVSPDIMQALLGMSTLEEAGVGPSSKPLNLERMDNGLSRTTNAMMDEIRQMRSTFMRLRIIKRSDQLEPVFFNLLLEDRSVAGMSYVEFLCHVHRQIQNKFA